MRCFQDDCFCRLWLALVSCSSRVTDVCVQRRAVTSSMCVHVFRLNWACADTLRDTRWQSHPSERARLRGSRREIGQVSRTAAGTSAVVDHGRWSVLCNLHRLPPPQLPPAPAGISKGLAGINSQGLEAK